VPTVLLLALAACVSDYWDDWDDDGVHAEADCDDSDPARWPGNVETCDGVDNDCDLQADEGGVCASEPDPDTGTPDIDTGESGTDTDAGDTQVTGTTTDTQDTQDADPPGDTGDPGLGEVPVLSLGYADACWIDRDQVLECWGRDLNSSGFSGAYADVGVGDGFACHLNTSGALTCFGSLVPANTPTGSFARVEAGLDHACALDSVSDIQCWGGSGGPDYVATPLGGPVGDMTAGSRDTCLLDSGAPYCWGVSPPETLKNLSQIATGDGKTCGVKTDGTLTCWGDDFEFAPTAQPPTGPDYSRVSVGVNHGCAIRRDGGVDCWGYNGSGQQDAPTLDEAQTWLIVEAGWESTCGITSEHELKCWGGSVTDTVGWGP